MIGIKTFRDDEEDKCNKFLEELEEEYVLSVRMVRISNGTSRYEVVYKHYLGD